MVLKSSWGSSMACKVLLYGALKLIVQKNCFGNLHFSFAFSRIWLCILFLVSHVCGQKKDNKGLPKIHTHPFPPNSKNMKSTQGTCIDLWCQCSPKSLSQMAVKFAVLENLCKLWQNILEHLEATKIPKPISSGKNVQALMKYPFQTAPKVLLFPLLPAFVWPLQFVVVLSKVQPCLQKESRNKSISWKFLTVNRSFAHFNTLSICLAIFLQIQNHEIEQFHRKDRIWLGCECNSFAKQLLASWGSCQHKHSKQVLLFSLLKGNFSATCDKSNVI